MIKESEKNAKKVFFFFFFLLFFLLNLTQSKQCRRKDFVFLPNILFSFFLLKRYRLKAKIMNNVIFSRTTSLFIKSSKFLNFPVKNISVKSQII